MTKKEYERAKALAEICDIARYGGVIESDIELISQALLHAHAENERLTAELAGKKQYTPITPPKGYAGWTCGICGSPVAGRYCKCEGCGLNPIEEDKKRRAALGVTG